MNKIYKNCIIEIITDEQLQKALLNAQEEQKSIVIDRINRDKSLTQEQKQEQISEAESIIDEESEQLLNALRLGETNGIIVGGKYIVRGPQVENYEGDILDGKMVVLAEFENIDDIDLATNLTPTLAFGFDCLRS